MILEHETQQKKIGKSHFQLLRSNQVLLLLVTFHLTIWKLILPTDTHTYHTREFVFYQDINHWVIIFTILITNTYDWVSNL